MKTKRNVLSLPELAMLENAAAKAATNEINIEDLTVAVMELAELISSGE